MKNLILLVALLCCVGSVISDALELQHHIVAAPPTCPDEENCPRGLGLCLAGTPNSNTAICVCTVVNLQIRNHCGHYWIEVYKDLYLLVALNFVFYTLGTAFVLLTLIYRLKNDKWQFNISNNCHIVLLIWGLATWLRSTTIQGSAWPHPLFYTGFTMIRTYCILACMILITDFWIQLTGTFTRGARKHVSKVDTFKEHLYAILAGLGLIFYDMSNFIDLHHGLMDWVERTPYEINVTTALYMISLVVAVSTLIVTILFGFNVILYFRKNNISGNLPITKMTILCLTLVISAFIVNTVAFIVRSGSFKTISTTTFTLARLEWFQDSFAWTWFFIILVTLRGGNFFDMFKLSSWKSKSDDTSKMVGESTTVTVSTSQTGGSSTGFSTSTATASSTVDTTTSD